MKILLLGATGDMGQKAATELARFPQVTHMTVTGTNHDRVRKLADSIGPVATPLVLDVNDQDALVATMKQHNVVAGAVGPYYLYEVPIAEAAIEAQISYVSICDDHDAAQEVLTLDDKARSAGVTILSGAGWTPGITSLMAKKGAALVGDAKEVHVAWAGASSDAQGHAVILHTLHILTGHVPTFSDGDWTRVRAGSGNETITFPDPIGTVSVAHVGHPEPVTIPRFLPGLETVTCRGGLSEPFLNRLSKIVTRTGITATNRGKALMTGVMTPFLPLLEKIGPQKPSLSGAHVRVNGVKNGRRVSVTMTAIGHMNALTAVPLAVATVMVGAGEISSPGVIPPEAPGGPDPDRFFEAMDKLGISVQVGPVIADNQGQRP